MPDHNNDKKILPHPHHTFIQHFYAAVKATFLATPLRSAMGQTVCLTSFIPTKADLLKLIQETYRNFYKNVGINCARGASMFTIMSFLEQLVKQHLGNEKTSYKLLALAAGASGSTAAATILETMYLNKNVARYNDTPRPLFHFSKYLTLFYFLREFGFGLGTLGKKSLPPSAYYPSLIFAIVVSSAMQRLITIGATEGCSSPNLKQEGYKALLKILEGQHPQLPVPFPIQHTSAAPRYLNLMYVRKLLLNASAISLNPVMISIRTAYMLFYGSVQRNTLEAFSKKSLVVHRHSLWQKPIGRLPDHSAFDSWPKLKRGMSI